MVEQSLFTKLLDKNTRQDDIEDMAGFRLIVVTYLFVHMSLEVLYIWCKCTPMILWNITSILVYVCQMIYARRQDASSVIIIWITNFEIYTHAIMATIFMGYGCGFFYWIFGLLIAIMIPYMTPMRNNSQRKIAFGFSFVYAFTTFLIPIFNYLDLFPVKYNPPEVVQTALNCVNTIILCFAIIMYISISIVRTERKEQVLTKAAGTDYLTNLYNRQHMQKVLLDKAENFGELSAAIMDVDHFKNINDTYGHMAGDYVLKEISSLLLRAADENITVGRWGGEEFLFVCEGKYSFEEFCRKLEDLRQEIADFKFEFSGIPMTLTASFGVATRSDGMTKEELIKQADLKLYSAKENGRNRVEF